MTKAHNRVYLMRLKSDNLESEVVLTYYRYLLVVKYATLFRGVSGVQPMDINNPQKQIVDASLQLKGRKVMPMAVILGSDPEKRQPFGTNAAVKMVGLNDRILEFHSDTVDIVRKDINLDKPGRMDEALDILEEWVKKQDHFLKKDFSRSYLETTLITAKGLVERAKQRMDKLCTFKTLMPEFYNGTISRETFSTMKSVVCHAHLPKMTKAHNRVYLMRLKSDNLESEVVLTYYRYLLVLSEYLKLHDYNTGFAIVLDFRDANILNFITKISPMDLRKIVTVMTEGYGMRIKRIDIISGSKMVDTLVAFFKQILSTKLGGRIHLHRNLDTLYEAVGRDIMPADYGGKEKYLEELNEQWLDVLCSKENVDFFQEMYKAKTDEACRRGEKFTENYIGMPGSFRALSVD